MDLHASLNDYLAYWYPLSKFYASYTSKDEQKNSERMLAFLDKPQNHYHRENLEGHFTASAFVINKSFTRTLLTHHRKLNHWLQLGGHADGNQNLAAVAEQEAQEESGIQDFLFWSPDRISKLHSFTKPFIFDIDVHFIPAYEKTPEHFHYDVRYLLITNDQLPITCSHESKALTWFTLSQAMRICEQKSMHRPLQKILWVAKSQNLLYPSNDLIDLNKHITQPSI